MDSVKTRANSAAAISRRLALKMMGVAVPTALVAGTRILDAPRAEALTTGAGLTYSVKNDGGLSANGTYDDQSVQRCLNAAAQNFCGEILIDVPVQITSNSVAIKIPSQGVYTIRGVAVSSDVYMVNDGYPPGEPVPGFVVTGPPGNQNPELPSGAVALFDVCEPNNVPSAVVNVSFRDFQVYNNFWGGPLYLASFNNGPYILEVNGCTLNCNGLVQATGGPGGQVFRITVKENIIQQALMTIGGAFGGEISGNVASEPEDRCLPSPYTAGVVGSFVHAESFPAFQIDHNFISSQITSGSKQRAVFCYRNLSQTEDGQIDHNCIYGCGGMVLYYKNDHGMQPLGQTLGLTFDYNQVFGWNMANITTGPGANGSAIVIDHSAATTNEQMIQIGPNIFCGGTWGSTDYAKRCIEIVDNPDTANVVFSKDQIIRTGTSSPAMVAGYRINSVDYVTSFPSLRFDAVLAAPSVPASTVALTNPFGFDCTVYASGRNLNDVAIDGVATGLKSGMFRVPRHATITLTYSSPPTWKWFAD